MPACTFCSFFHKTGRPFAAGCKLAHKNATLKKCTLYQENSSSGERWTSALIPFSECFGPFRNSETKRQLHATMHQAAGESSQTKAIGWIDDPRVMFSLGLAAATCRSHLVSLTWWPFDNTGQSSREPSPRISSHTRTCPFHRTPRGKQARRTTWGPSFWQTIMWTIHGLVVLHLFR